MRVRVWPVWSVCLLVLLGGAGAKAETVQEYDLKAAFIYNFSTYTEWPDEVGSTLVFCTYDYDPFGAGFDGLQGKSVGDRHIAIQRPRNSSSLGACHLIFFTDATMGALPGLLKGLRGKPVLTIADSDGAARLGVVLNMALSGNRVTFEANQGAALRSGLKLSSRLLRLATEVLE